eukprot:10173220-Prorocentrum_lima.AAC.1
MLSNPRGLSNSKSVPEIFNIIRKRKDFAINLIALRTRRKYSTPRHMLLQFLLHYCELDVP